MSGLFVTGTDTEVGKTLVCGHLLAYLRRRGWNAISQKWVQTGGAQDQDDLQTHLEIAGLGADDVRGPLHLMRPYAFQFPASPHLSARLAGRTVCEEPIRRAYAALRERFDPVLVEGTGGPLVPLGEGLILADLVADLGLPALVVAANRLGCINHALLTVEALKQRRIPVAGLVFNRPDAGGDEEVLNDNPAIIATLSGVPVLGELPWLEQPLAGGEQFEPIGQEFLKRWKEVGQTP